MDDGQRPAGIAAEELRGRIGMLPEPLFADAVSVIYTSTGPSSRCVELVNHSRVLC